MSLPGGVGVGAGSGTTAAAAFSLLAIGLGFSGLPMPDANRRAWLRVLAEAGEAVVFAGVHVVDGGPEDLVRLGMVDSPTNTGQMRGRAADEAAEVITRTAANVSSEETESRYRWRAGQNPAQVLEVSIVDVCSSNHAKRCPMYGPLSPYPLGPHYLLARFIHRSAILLTGLPRCRKPPSRQAEIGIANAHAVTLEEGAGVFLPWRSKLRQQCPQVYARADPRTRTSHSPGEDCSRS